jgi:hypothetical protein
VSVGAAVLDDPVFYIIDLGQLWDVEGVVPDGLVGYEMFRRFGVEIDYERRQLTLTEASKFTPPSGATAITFEFDDRIPIISGALDGVPLRMSVDTGARTSLTLNSPFVKAHDLVQKYRAAPLSITGWGAGGAERAMPARFGTLLLGDIRIDAIAGDLYTGNKGASANPDLGGNLGSGVLKRFVVAFDYDNKKMYLAPNREPMAPDSYDRSGLWLLAHDDKFKVVEVAAGSAAEQAGLKANDLIVAIDGEAVSKRSLAGWRSRLSELPAGTALSVIVDRKKHKQVFRLILADRIPAHWN